VSQLLPVTPSWAKLNNYLPKMVIGAPGNLFPVQVQVALSVAVSFTMVITAPYPYFVD